MTAEEALAPAEWGDLARELDAWAADGRRATLWWRDDDAAHAGPELDGPRLAAAIAAALAAPAPSTLVLRGDGAAHTAAIVADLARNQIW